MEEKKTLKGGEFTICESSYQNVFTPEEFTEEDRMIAQSVQDFVDQKIHSNTEKIEKQEEGILEKLLDEVSEMGLVGITIDPKYGGMGLSTNTMLLVTDIFGASGSFATTYGVQSGIGLLPIYYFGNEAQKEKYLPNIISGKTHACYCLTEPSAGSDANSGKTKAILSNDGKYYEITGQKMWISNGGFAGLFIVFAKIEDDKNLSAFIVEKDFGGITLNPEEKKLGIKGSSTRQVFFNKTKVPVENLLSEREMGFKIAVNILNLGRIKLGVGALGGARAAIQHAHNYAKEREQFGQPIFNFGAIKSKLADMHVLCYANEAIGYRIGQDMANQIEEYKSQGMPESKATLKGVEQYAIEASISKVFGSEVMSFIADEGLQVYGGMGFSAEAPMEKIYRDTRILRIYEGTNEINRMLAVGMLLKRAMKGELALLQKAQEIGKELTGLPQMGGSVINDDENPFAVEKKHLENLKKGFLIISGKAAQKYAQELEKQQEIMLNLADILIQIYATECSLLRAEKIYHTSGKEKAERKMKMAKVFLYKAAHIVSEKAREVLDSMNVDSDEKRFISSGLKRFLKPYEINVIQLKREICDSYELSNFPFN